MFEFEERKPRTRIGVTGAINQMKRQLLIYLDFVRDTGLVLVAASFAKNSLERRIFGGLFKNLRAEKIGRFLKSIFKSPAKEA